MYKEYTRPLEQHIDTDKNIFSVLEERVNRTPNDSLVEYKNEHGEWASFSATEFRDKVIAIAKGLIAQGIMPGDSVSSSLTPAGSGLRLTWRSCRLARSPSPYTRRIRLRRLK